MRRIIACSALILVASSARAQDTTVVVVRHIPSVQDTAVVVRHINSDSAASSTRAPRRMSPPNGPPYGTRFPARSDITVLAKDPHYATGLSLLFPGGGQYYSENPGKGFLITALAIGAPLIGYANVHHYDDNIAYAQGFACPAFGCGPQEARRRTDWTPAAIGLTVGIASWFYGIVTAGSDAEKWNKSHNVRLTAAPGRFGLAVALP